MSYDLGELPKLLNDLYDVVSRLEAIAPGRKFTPDGHLVGSIGETVAAYAYGIELLPASVKQHDARTRDGRCVQIKLTQGTSVSLSYDCEHLLVLQLSRSTGFIEVYNGPGAPVWQEIGSKAAVGRQRQITLSRLKTFPQSRHAISRIRRFPDLLPRLIPDTITPTGALDQTITAAKGRP